MPVEQPGAALAAQLHALHALAGRWRRSIAELQGRRTELDVALMSQAMGQLRAYRDVASATGLLREQVALAHAPRGAADWVPHAARVSHAEHEQQRQRQRAREREHDGLVIRDRVGGHKCNNHGRRDADCLDGRV